MPDEAALLTARRDAVRLRDLAAGLGGAATVTTELLTTELLTTELLATVHGLQADVFESVLRSGGVPPAEIAGTPSTTPPPTSTSTSTATSSADATAGGAATDPTRAT